jgi:hypothetical protein
MGPTCFGILNNRHVLRATCYVLRATCFSPGNIRLINVRLHVTKRDARPGTEAYLHDHFIDNTAPRTLQYWRFVECVVLLELQVGIYYGMFHNVRRTL